MKQHLSRADSTVGSYLGVMNGPLKFLTARKILPLLGLLAKFKRVLACSRSPNFCVARKLVKQIFYFCSCSQKNRSAQHARECSQRPFVTPLFNVSTIHQIEPTCKIAICQFPHSLVAKDIKDEIIE